MDRVLGGGWAQGRVGNIVGDTSTGKTLGMIELCANFVLLYPNPRKGLIRYREVESAFDEPYAVAVGLPLKRVDFHRKSPVSTVEDFYEDLCTFCDKVEGVQFVAYVKVKRKDGTGTKFVRKTKPIAGAVKADAGLYILDSLDAIGDDAEEGAEFGANSFGGKKPKLMSQLFRRIVRRLERLNVTLLIVSQVRDKIGVMFGKKHTRTGGKALDFYASQILWLTEKGKIVETRGGVKRKVGVWIGARCEKNKVGLAWRDCDFPIRYAYGIDDFEAGLTWLLEVRLAAKLGLSEGKQGRKDAAEYLKALDAMQPAELQAERVRLNGVLDEAWWKIERRFLPVRKKYA